MIQITVSDEQARVIAEASPPIIIVDSHGRALGQLAPVDPETAAQPGISADDWAEIKRRKQNPGEYFTLQQIKEHLGWQDQK